MHLRTTIPTLPVDEEGQRRDLVIISPSKAPATATYLPAPPSHVPADLIQDIGALFASEIDNARRLFYRGILLKAQVVSVVDFTRASFLLGASNFSVAGSLLRLPITLLAPATRS
ncbi:hypothetical protein ACJZ2D_001734 [Fusarium nematophilum]